MRVSSVVCEITQEHYDVKDGLLHSKRSYDSACPVTQSATDGNGRLVPSQIPRRHGSDSVLDLL